MSKLHPKPAWFGWRKRVSTTVVFNVAKLWRDSVPEENKKRKCENLRRGSVKISD